jgi:chromatin assembly factor 1 subunit A
MNQAFKPFFAPPSAFSNLSTGALQTPLPAASKGGKEKKVLSPEDLASFKEEVQGSNLSKVGLIEVLKKKFPKATGSMVKATLEAVAQRVGKKESEKRWIVNDDAGSMGVAST